MKNCISLKIIFVILSLSAFGNCSRKHVEDNNHSIKVEFIDNVTFKFSDIFDRLEFIALETTDNNLFKEVSEINIKNNKIFVFSKFPDNLVSVYNLSGKLLYCIGSHGRGPGEMAFSTSFDVSRNIMILDRGNSKITNYDLNGKYISEIKTDKMYDNIKAVNDSVFVLHDNNFSIPINSKTHKEYPADVKNTFWELDNKGSIAKIFAAKDLNKGIYLPIINSSFCNISASTLYYWAPFNDSIYGVNIETRKSKLFTTLNFDKYKVPQEVLDRFRRKTDGSTLIDLGRKEYARINEFMFCNKDLLFFLIRKGTSYYLGFTSSHEKTLNCFSKLCIDIIHSELEVLLSRHQAEFKYYDSQSAFYFSWPAVHFIKSFETLKTQLSVAEWEHLLKTNPSLEYTLSKIHIDDNPIILKAHLK